MATAKSHRLALRERLYWRKWHRVARRMGLILDTDDPRYFLEPNPTRVAAWNIVRGLTGET